MQASELPSTFWLTWLFAATIGVMALGLVLVLAPDLTCQGFSLLIYANTNHINAFGSEAVRYIALSHAVLGSVMFGWGVALLFAIRGLFARGVKDSWQIVAVSVIAWFVPDTAFSLWSGFWQNALLNVAFATLFALPLAATYRTFYEKHV